MVEIKEEEGRPMVEYTTTDGRKVYCGVDRFLEDGDELPELPDSSTPDPVARQQQGQPGDPDFLPERKKTGEEIFQELETSDQVKVLESRIRGDPPG